VSTASAVSRKDKALWRSTPAVDQALAGDAAHCGHHVLVGSGRTRSRHPGDEQQAATTGARAGGSRQAHEARPEPMAAKTGWLWLYTSRIPG